MKRLDDISLSPNQQQALAEVRRKLLNYFDVEEIVLYGSFDREYVETQLARCTQFLAELRPLISVLARE